MKFPCPMFVLISVLLMSLVSGCSQGTETASEVPSRFTSDNLQSGSNAALQPLAEDLSSPPIGTHTGTSSDVATIDSHRDAMPANLSIAAKDASPVLGEATNEKSRLISAPADERSQSRRDDNSPELRELILKMNEWKPESSDRHCRRRPVMLIIICDDYPGEWLGTPEEIGVEFGNRLAHCGYDVHFLIGVKAGAKPEDHPTMGKVCLKLMSINKELNDRNMTESSGLPEKDVVPLRLLSRPDVFSSANDLNAAISRWLTDTFRVRTIVEERSTWQRRQRGEKGLVGRLGGVPKNVAPDAVENEASATITLDARPPFGGIYLRGHGISVSEKSKLHQQDQIFVTPDCGHISLNAVAKTALRAHGAPIYIIPDTCREEVITAVAQQNVPDGHQGGSVKTWSRKLQNLDVFDTRYSELIAEIERLRSSAAPNNVLADWQPERHGNGEDDGDATFLWLHHGKVAIKDDPGHSLGLELSHAIIRNDRGEFEAIDNSGEATLLRWFNVARTKLEEGGIFNPAWTAYGPIDRNMVVVASRRHFVYPRAYPNIADHNFKVNETWTQVAVPHEPNELIGADVVVMTQDLKTTARAYFDLDKPFELQAEVIEGKQIRQDVVLHLRASCASNAKSARSQSQDKLRVIVGIYDTPGTPLNSTFDSRDNGEGYTRPTPCDGSDHFIRVPLDRVAVAIPAGESQSEPPAIRHIEIQSFEWLSKTSLFLMGVYVIPSGCELSDIEGQAALRVRPETVRPAVIQPSATRNRAGAKAPEKTGVSLISEWWSGTTLLNGDPKLAVRRSLTKEAGIGNDKGKLKDKLTLEYQGDVPESWWGVTGSLYPARLVFPAGRDGEHRIKFTVEGEGGEGSEIGLVFYSGDRVLAAWKGLLVAARRGARVDVTEPGSLDEIAIVAKDVKSIRITELAIQNQ